MGCVNSGHAGGHGCCPPGSWPALQLNYSPEGRLVTLEGVSLYEVGSGNKHLVLIQDIFGIESGRHKTVADTYAALGFRVYLPELLDPPYSGPIEDIPKLIATVKLQKIPEIKSKYERLSAYIKSQGSDSFVVAGFCWGAWTAFRMSADYNNIKAIAAIHPSLNVEGIYGGTEASLVEAVRCPVFFYSCSNDQPGTKKGGEYLSILQKRFGEKVGCEQFPNQQHGFVMRSDPSLESAREDTKKIIRMSVEYFDKFY